jgi:hypothetical protein
MTGDQNRPYISAEHRRPTYISQVRIPLRPFVRLAVRVLGPGPLRLRLVKFAHGIDSYEPTQGNVGRAA